MKFSPKNLSLFATVAFLPVVLLGCDKQAPSPATKPATSPASAVTSSTTTTSTSTISNTTATLPTSSATLTPTNPTLPSLPASATSTTTTTVITDNKASKSLITQPTAPNTPEDTLKKAMDALMVGNAKEAANYYHIDGMDMAQMLAQQIPVVQKQLKHLEISPTEYNADKTKAGIIGKLTLVNSKQPKQALYKFEKINGEWKIVE